MTPKTCSSSQSSARPCSRTQRAEAARLLCPAELPGLSLSTALRSTAAHPRHVHDSLILGVVTQGARSITTPQGQHVVLSGEVFALAPGLAHACCPAPTPQAGQCCSYLAFSLTPEALARQLPTREPGTLPVRIVDENLATGLTRLGEAVQSQAGPLERQSLLAEVLERLAAHAQTEKEEQPQRERDEGLAQAVRQAQGLLAADLSPGLSLSDLAQACGVETFALHRAFTRLVGLPPHAHQTHLRLRRAKELLRQGASPPEAALEAGFCDQSHMNRHFARLVGQTPAQYAKAHAQRK